MRIAAAVAAMSAAIIEALTAGIGLVAAGVALALLVATAVWGRRLLKAYQKLNERVETLEQVVFRDEG